MIQATLLKLCYNIQLSDYQFYNVGDYFNAKIMKTQKFKHENMAVSSSAMLFPSIDFDSILGNDSR